MLDRLESISRLLCVGLGALLFLQLVNAVWHGDPLFRATIPDLPTLAAAPVNTNSTDAAAPPARVQTNSTEAVKTNAAPTAKATAPATTNSAPVAGIAETGKTNLSSSTNIAEVSKTNSAPVARIRGHRPGMPGFGPGKKVDLPPAVQARVQSIVESEILGPYMRPMPMALLGIAGENAFLRAPDGQSGMVKEGAELGTIKLLRIGTNRVLVEENGEKKELMVFEGIGGESLLPPITNSTVKTNGPMAKQETH